MPHLLCTGSDIGCSKNFPFLVISIRTFSITVLDAEDKYMGSYELIPIKSNDRGLLESEFHTLNLG